MYVDPKGSTPDQLAVSLTSKPIDAWHLLTLLPAADFEAGFSRNATAIAGGTERSEVLFPQAQSRFCHFVGNRSSSSEGVPDCADLRRIRIE